MSWVNEMSKNKGSFERVARTFRNFISSKPGSEFPPEKNRYHLYVSYACPWACRTLTMRSLKGLEDIISFDVVDTHLVAGVGWTLQEKDPGSTPDSINGLKTLKEVYLKADPNYSQSITVPVLWDKKNETIVNNESSEIIRMFNSEFNEFSKYPKLDFYPEELRSKIDEINDWVYTSINNGVYRCGFASTQEAYEEAYHKLFDAMDKVEEILSKNRYLTGNTLTEADIRLFQTLVRFDPVYVTHFKCNKKRVIDYPNIWNYVKELYQMEGFKKNVNLFHIKKHYFYSHRTINPYGIIPVGPEVNFEEAHNRNETHPIK